MVVESCRRLLSILLFDVGAAFHFTRVTPPFPLTLFHVLSRSKHPESFSISSLYDRDDFVMTVWLHWFVRVGS